VKDNYGSVQVTGPLFDLEQKIFKQLGTYLKIQDFEIVPKLYASSEELFAALSSGKIDVTTGSMLAGASVEGDERRGIFEYTCSTGAWPMIVITPKKKNNDETIKDLSTLKAFLKNNEQKKLAVANSAMAALITDSLDMEVAVRIVDNTEDAYAKLLENGDYVAYVPEYMVEFNTQYEADLHKIITDEYVTTTMFLRKDRKVVLESSSLAFVATTGFLVIFFITAFGYLSMFLFLKWYNGRTVKSNNAQMIEIVEDKTALLNGMESIGDDDDPDYIAPSF
jgi:hypothetical protein